MQPTTTKSGFTYFPMDIAVARDSSLKGFEKIVYLVICSHADIKRDDMHFWEGRIGHFKSIATQILFRVSKRA